MPTAREAERYHAHQLLHLCRKEGIGNERRLERSAHVASADRNSLVDLALQRFARVGVAWCAGPFMPDPRPLMRTNKELGVNWGLNPREGRHRSARVERPSSAGSPDTAYCTRQDVHGIGTAIE